MIDDIEILEKIIEDEKRSGSSYISVTIPNEERQKEVKAISNLLNEYKELKRYLKEAKYGI